VRYSRYIREGVVMDENIDDDKWAAAEPERAAILKQNKEKMEKLPTAVEIIDRVIKQHAIKKEIQREKKQQAKLNDIQQEKHARLLNTGLFEEDQ
jgi:hypothetical protein